MKSILLVAFDFNPAVGSEARLAYTWAKLLRKHYNVSVITDIKHRKSIEEAGDNLEIEYFTFVSEPARALLEKIRAYNLLYRLFAHKVKRKLKKTGLGNIDLIHCLTPAGFYAYNQLYKLGKPVVTGPVGGGLRLPDGFEQYQNLKYKMRELYYRLVKMNPNWAAYYRNCTKILIGTGSLLLHLPQNTHEKTVEFFDTVVDADKFIPAGNRDSEYVTILYSGRMDKTKGCFLLLQAFKLLLEDGYRSIRLIMLGDGPEYKRLTKLVRKEKLEESVQLPGNVGMEQVKYYLDRADIFCLPALKEHGGTAILEAMSCELPVVTTDYGGPAVSVTDKCGIKIKPSGCDGYLKDLKNALAFLIDNKDIRRELGAEGRKRVLSNYCHQSLEYRIKEFYDDIFSEETAGRKLKILFVNKFLYPKGGSETYMFGLSDYMKNRGHKIDFFGMEHSRNTVANSLGLDVKNKEFHGGGRNKLINPLKIIYSPEARRKIRKIIRYDKPDIIHLNNYNYQITPSILYEIKKHNIPVVMTLHDFQPVCPNHMLYREHDKKVCEDCKARKYISCIKNRCIHNSRVKSLLGALEAFFYYRLDTYNRYIDCYISPSRFLRDKMTEFGEPPGKITVIHNFVNGKQPEISGNEKYVLYFGRLSVQKGIHTLIEACKRLPDICFVVAGGGELSEALKDVENIRYMGHKSGQELREIIAGALFSVCPSEWYENCPMSVLESQMYGTPVVASRIGGIQELIKDGKDGFLFKPGDVDDLVNKIDLLYRNENLLRDFSERCRQKVIQNNSVEKYYCELMKVYALAVGKHGERGG